MRRHPTATLIATPPIITTIQILTTALAAAALATGFVNPARAQSPESRCPAGLMTSGEAGTGRLLLKTATPGCFLPAPRVAADIAVNVAGPIARTRVTQRFENPAEGWVEGVYLFPLPETAAVDTMKMQIGERFIEGEIKEREQARRIYEAAKSEGKTASLVEQERPNVFTNSIANIGPHETITVQIEYQENLRFESSQYHLRVPLVVAPRYSPKPRGNVVSVSETGTLVHITDPVPDRERLDAPVLKPEWGKVNPVTLGVHIEAGFRLGNIESASHPVTVMRDSDTAATVRLAQSDIPADRDFELDFGAQPDAAPAVSLLKETIGDNDYLLALVVPPVNAAAVPAKPREVVFVLDNSGSMGGESIRQAKASLLLALDRLTPADMFNVIRFDDTLTVLFHDAVRATNENIAYAKGYVSHIEAQGGTEMLPALLAALKDAAPEDSSRLRQVVFLTDGEVGNEAELFKAIGEKLGRTRLFTVGIGSAPNAYFMSGAARAGRGTYTYIGNIDQVTPHMAELFAKLERPVMTELSVRWPDGLKAEAWPNPLPDLYQGEPVVVAVKGENASGSVVLFGNLAGQPWEQTIDLSNAQSAHGIEKLWARFRIAALDESRVRGVDPVEIDNQVLATALGHHLASRLTSLVAVDVTPRRPEGATLTSARIPLNLPAGWDFGKVFGETREPRERSAQTPLSAPMLANLKVNSTPRAALAPEDAGLALPQGGTDAELMMIAGLLLLLAGYVMLKVKKEA